MTNEEVIRKVLRTEKGENLSAQNRYMIEVAPAARKPQIAEAVEKKYGVHVVAVRTVKVKGAEKYIRGTRLVRKESDRKKAYVTVRPGERIEEV
jgi:large subunit ribosomal protein L23